MSKPPDFAADRNGGIAENPGARTPIHVAIIMDGNGRWARARHLPRIEGHRAGAKSVRMVVEESRKLGIRYLTLFAFSTENWSRPVEEVHSLMELFARYLRSELAELISNGIRLRAIGDIKRLPGPVADALQHAQEESKDRTDMDLILALSYGGRDELVRATRTISQEVLQGKLKVEDIDETLIGNSLLAPDIPDPDLLIRTSGVSRISNFLLWQLAYSEILVTPTLWPDFSGDEYRRCIKEFASRERRFGLTDEQAKQLSCNAT